MLYENAYIFIQSFLRRQVVQNYIRTDGCKKDLKTGYNSSLVGTLLPLAWTQSDTGLKDDKRPAVALNAGQKSGMKAFNEIIGI